MTAPTFGSVAVQAHLAGLQLHLPARLRPQDVVGTGRRPGNFQNTNLIVAALTAPQAYVSAWLRRRVALSEILDRKEAAKLAGLSENHFTNGLMENFPSYYYADATRFGPEGLMLFLRSDVEHRLSWRGEWLEWPPKSDEPSADDFIKLLGGGVP